MNDRSLPKYAPRCFAIVVASLLWSSAGFAQLVDSATRASARQLAEEGMAQYDKDNCVAAAEKLGRAHEMVHVSTLAFYAGKCLEKLGRLVDASEMYLAATRDTIDPGAPPTQKVAQDDAASARVALLPRIPTIELVLDASATGATVTLDGAPFPGVAFGVKRPIDPGHHIAEVQRGNVHASREFALDEADNGRIVLSLPRAPVVSRPPAPTSFRPSAGPWIVGGVGVVSAIVGAVLGGVVLQEKSATSKCTEGPPPTCPTQAGIDAANVGRALGPAATALLAVGGAGIVVGGIWLGLRPSSKTSVRLGVDPVVGAVAWRVVGTW